PLAGDLLTDARVGYSQYNEPVVNISFNRQGTRKFGQLTKANVGKRMAIVLDKVVYSAPVIREEISGGSKGGSDGDNDLDGGNKGGEKGGGSQGGEESNESGDVDLEIGFALQDTDGSESISGDIILTDVPEGAILSVGEAGENGTWVISQDDLAVTATNDAGDPIAWEIPGLTITPAEGTTEDFSLGIQITTQDGDDTNLVEGSINIDVADEDEAPAEDNVEEQVEVDPDPEPEPVVEVDVEPEGEADSEEVEYDNEIEGTDKSDHIDGTDGNDDIDGGLKNDHIDGGAGDDKLVGGEGNDQLVGGDGNDILIGGEGNDQIDGGAGDDTFITGNGNDHMDGGDGSDLFIFGADSGGMNDVDGGAGQGWVDTIQIEGVEGPPGGDWTIDTDAEYTIDAENNTIDFTDGDASGTITLEDGSTLDFDNIEDITW
ncbi:MAG: hypothetical protein HQL70_05480, partial [Magnetococcales bacterium]|nr:hypothetical protein [Magnetococcales bacterium]